jgi:hypothetical protein
MVIFGCPFVRTVYIISIYSILFIFSDLVVTFYKNYFIDKDSFNRNTTTCIF